MAVAQSLILWNQKKLFLFVRRMLRFQSNKATLGTETNPSSVKGKELPVNNCSSGIDMCRDKKGRLEERLDNLNTMKHQGIRPDSNMYGSLLERCVKRKALSEGKLIHGHMIDMGFVQEIFLGTKLVIMYAKCGTLVDARRVLDEMPERNVVAWTTMITAYARHGLNAEALALFYQMQRDAIRPNNFTFSGVLPAAANLAALKHGMEMHGDITRNGFQSDIFVGSALVDMYAKCGQIEDARKVFDEMPERNVVSWNAMIAGYSQNGHVDEAAELFQNMPERDVVSWTVMIDAYAQDGQVGEALMVFQKMPATDVVSWTAMIAGYAQNGQVEEALKLFQKMPAREVVSWNAMLAGYAQNGQVSEVQKLFQKMPERDAVSWTAMIAGYAQIGQADEAMSFFRKMPEPKVVSWNVMIGGYAQNGQFNEALKLFRQMQLIGVKPDSVTFTSVLPACASMAALINGKEVHENIIRSGFLSHISVGNALVDMYAKCGTINDACEVFDTMPERDIVSWNAMIAGYAKHGYGKEALHVFEQMQHSGMNPNHVTFVGVLSACSHSGLVDAGRQYFDCMRQDYHITPVVEHYCCMVDLLGRAGCLDEAQDLIQKMPIKPDAAVWGSLLGACRIHVNIELGEWVAERLFELNPQNAACYVLLSNIYAAAGRWDGVEKVRKIMQERKVKKTPGCSWIEVNSKVYSFFVGDKSHPQMHEIYAEWERLSQLMKEKGYVPDTNSVLHDVEEEQKEHILCHHSEKLAIAFGLIHMSPGMPIRIVKNLRVCGDCHSATKFISKIIAQEIVVRDANRFHHFKDGQCSCGDYW